MEEVITQDLVRLEKVVRIKGTGIEGLTATCLERTSSKALYKRSDEEYECYEVFKIKVQEATLLNGYEYPRKEKYPSNEGFGKSAWCYRSYEEAKRKYDEI